jgi:hypothetical protein
MIMPDKFKQLVLTLFVFLIGFSQIHAQDNYQKWLKKDQQQFNKFLEEEDRAFLDFLKKDWQEYLSAQGIVFDKKPKPKNIPVAKKKDKPEAPLVDKIKKVKDIPVPQKKPLPPPPPKPPVKKQEHVITINYFGANVSVNYKRDFKLDLKSPINNEVICAAWQRMGSSKYKDLLKQLQNHKKQMALNDWGYVLLVHQTAKKIFPGSESKRNLFIWFLIIKSGYDAKIAYKENNIFLLLPNENLIYENRYVTLDNKKFYFISIDGKVNLDGKVYTYNGKYEGANKLIALKLPAVPQITNKIISKSLHFKFKNKEYQIDVQYDNDIVDFFKKYPQTEIKIYFEAPISNYADYSLLNALKPHVKGKSELEAVNFLLRFIQTAFDYKTDDQQFGREKYLMPEETIFYPSSDCEDRSILFSYLVRHLLGMEIIVLDYPGHIATAVHFSSDIPGDVINYKGKKYTVCDPTYINADAGMAMPEFKKVEPKVIQL